MDQGEQVDFLTELQSQPPVSVSFKDSHKHTTVPSPTGVDKQSPSGDQSSSIEKKKVSVMAEG